MSEIDKDSNSTNEPDPDFKVISRHHVHYSHAHSNAARHSFQKKNVFCNNCGKNGHLMHACKNPITSNGIIVFKDSDEGACYLMIRRKDTLGFVEFIRGKYPIYNKMYLQRLIDEMTLDEKRRLQTQTFSELWTNVWGDYLNAKYQNEETVSCERFNLLKNGVKINRGNGNSYSFTLNDLIESSSTRWTEPEWGFPKGRRNYQEKDMDCALREFAEETGYDASKLIVMQNIVPYEEIFMGSNVKTYKHKYYVAYFPLSQKPTTNPSHVSGSPKFQKTEVSKMAWFSFEECMKHIRPYNLEKINILRNLNNALKEYEIAC
jgi:8-oxo-dGTP pyrophosphatase MutT (NUDIX family)